MASKRYVAQTTIVHGTLVDGKAKVYRFNPGATIPTTVLGGYARELLASGAITVKTEPAKEE